MSQPFLWPIIAVRFTAQLGLLEECNHPVSPEKQHELSATPELSNQYDLVRVVVLSFTRCRKF